jgi:regulator of replication initiation timing
MSSELIEELRSLELDVECLRAENERLKKALRKALGIVNESTFLGMHYSHLGKLLCEALAEEEKDGE